MNYIPNRPEKGRTEYTIDYTFHDAESGFEEEVIIYLPWDMLINTVVDFCNANYCVNIDGKDTDVWNLFAGTNFFDDLFEDEDFLKAITKAYENSIFIIGDYHAWSDSKPWEEEECYCE